MSFLKTKIHIEQAYSEIHRLYLPLRGIIYEGKQLTIA